MNSSSLLELKGIGPKTAAKLADNGLTNCLDLLFFLPRRYDDRRTVTPLAQVIPGQRVVTSGQVVRTRVYGRKWRRIMELELCDGDNTIRAMWFSNAHPRTDRFKKGDLVTLAGLVTVRKEKLQIAYPTISTQSDPNESIGRIVPVYGKIPKVPGTTIEKAIADAVEQIDELITDPLPKKLLAANNLMPLAEALSLVHIPPNDADDAQLDDWVKGNSPAHVRLAYDEFFFMQLALIQRKIQYAQNQAPPINHCKKLPEHLGGLMGFTPTKAQSRVIDEIVFDLKSERPMQRLLQGDVGSGKTFVATAAMAAMAQTDIQIALMAPTEILAQQHMRTLSPILEKLKIKASLHVGQLDTAEKRDNLKAFESGTTQIAIGTHALFQESVQFNNLGLVIIDEQHRFGVKQRLSLVGKSPNKGSPHLLVMTATPIPRSLALTIHGDLDISILDELPPGRTKIETKLWNESQRDQVFDFVHGALERGEQAYIVCPIIEESDKLNVRSARDVFKKVTARMDPQQTGLLHGKLPPNEKDQVMNDFTAGRIKVLVTTTVIEVGVDVPNATVMVIEGAERFGLAQLHQLRGRIGRCSKPSSCHLIVGTDNDETLGRLHILEKTTDGFEVAQADLDIRGPGELFGKKQSGLPDLRWANLVSDTKLLESARRDAASLLGNDPDLSSPSNLALGAELNRRIMAGDHFSGE